MNSVDKDDVLAKMGPQINTKLLQVVSSSKVHPLKKPKSDDSGQFGPQGDMSKVM